MIAHPFLRSYLVSSAKDSISDVSDVWKQDSLG